MKKHLSLMVGLVTLLCVIIAASFALTSLQEGHSAQSLTAQKCAVERAAVLCYALEGAYPPTVDYLEAHYGLQINRDRYIVRYETIGANIRPEIAVYAYD